MDNPVVKSGFSITLSDGVGVIGMGDPVHKVIKGQVSGDTHIYKYSKEFGEW